MVGPLAIALVLSMGLAPSASAAEPADASTDPGIEATQAFCWWLGDEPTDAIGCAESLVCGYPGCLEAWIWSP